jgi:antiviral helicase SLH1
VALYSRQWLEEKSLEVSQRGSGLDASTLQEQISAILASDSSGSFRRLYFEEFR